MTFELRIFELRIFNNNNAVIFTADEHELYFEQAKFDGTRFMAVKQYPITSHVCYQLDVDGIFIRFDVDGIFTHHSKSKN